jgi:hypothetical protein
MLLDGISRYVKRARYLMAGQEVENPAETAFRTEPALRQHGQAAAVLGTFAMPGCLAVDVKGERDGNIGAIWPGRELCARDHSS